MLWRHDMALSCNAREARLPLELTGPTAGA